MEKIRVIGDSTTFIAYPHDRLRLTANVSVNAVTGTVYGDQAGDKTMAGLWPSDHGGVFVRATMNR